MKRASKAAEYAAKKHYTSYNKKLRNSAFHSGGFGGAELLKQRFSQLRFWKSFKLRTGRLLDCPVFSKVQKGKVLFYRQDACGQKLQALERHGY